MGSAVGEGDQLCSGDDGMFGFLRLRTTVGVYERPWRYEARECAERER